MLGEPRFGGILIVSDHASNRVPADIDLGIDPALLAEHVAIDLGVAEVAARMARQPGTAAFLGNVVVWRGERFRVSAGGKLTRIDAV